MNRVDFAVVITAQGCNPNGDPLDGNRPRFLYDGRGEMSSVCLKRKVRDYLAMQGDPILIMPDTVVLQTLKASASVSAALKSKDVDLAKKAACKEWFDVRAFGSLLPFKGSEVSISVRGPVSIGDATSLSTIEVIDKCITRVCNFETAGKLESSTMGHRYTVMPAVYVAYGGIFPQLASLTGFTDQDAEKIKRALAHMFRYDAAYARPAGSMTSTLFWWTHPSETGAASPAKVHHSLHVVQHESYPYFSWTADPVDGVNLEVLGENTTPACV